MTVNILNREKAFYHCLYYFEGTIYGMGSDIYFQEEVLEKVKFNSLEGWIVDKG